MPGVLIRGEDTDSEGRELCEERSRERCSHKPGNHQMPGDGPGAGPQSDPRRNQPCQHLDFRLLVSEVVRESVSVILSHPDGCMATVAPGNERTVWWQSGEG